LALESLPLQYTPVKHTVTTTYLNTSHHLSALKINIAYTLTLFTDLWMSIQGNRQEIKTDSYCILNLSHTLKDKPSQQLYYSNNTLKESLAF